MKISTTLSCIGAVAASTFLTSCYEYYPPYPGQPYPPGQPGPPQVQPPPAQKELSHYSISGVQVIQMPAYKSARFPWDAKVPFNNVAHHPDVQATITSAGKTTFRSAVMRDRAHNSSYFLRNISPGNSKNTYCTIRVVDRDKKNHDHMLTASFSVPRPAPGAPTAGGVTVNSGGASLRVNYRWHYR